MCVFLPGAWSQDYLSQSGKPSGPAIVCGKDYTSAPLKSFSVYIQKHPRQEHFLLRSKINLISQPSTSVQRLGSFYNTLLCWSLGVFFLGVDHSLLEVLEGLNCMSCFGRILLNFYETPDRYRIEMLWRLFLSSSLSSGGFREGLVCIATCSQCCFEGFLFLFRPLGCVGYFFGPIL